MPQKHPDEKAVRQDWAAGIEGDGFRNPHDGFVELPFHQPIIICKDVNAGIIRIDLGHLFKLDEGFVE